MRSQDMTHDGGIETRLGRMIATDHRPALRCGGRAIATVTKKQFSADRGFGDCPMFIKYAFRTDDGLNVLGNYTATESSFYALDVGDEIAIRYLLERRHINAPEDALSILRPIREDADIAQNDG